MDKVIDFLYIKMYDPYNGDYENFWTKEEWKEWAFKKD